MPKRKQRQVVNRKPKPPSIRELVRALQRRVDSLESQTSRWHTLLELEKQANIELANRIQNAAHALNGTRP